MRRPDPDTILWFSRPARILLTEGLPLGNGSLGALLAGGVAVERIALSEKGLWSGGPGETEDWNYGIPREAAMGEGLYPSGDGTKAAHGRVAAVRALLAEGRETEALRLSNRTLAGDPRGYGSNEVLGHLALSLSPTRIRADNYTRSLDPRTGLHETRWTFRRASASCRTEAFCSYPDQVFAWRLESGEDLGLEIAWEMAQRGKDWRHLYPGLAARIEAPGTGREERVTRTSSGFLVEGRLRANGLRYAVALGRGSGMDPCPERGAKAAMREMGKRGRAGGDSATVRLAGREGWLVLAAAVERPSPDWRPPRDAEEGSARSAALRDTAQGRVEAALALGWENLRARHVEDVGSLMGRCTLKIEDPAGRAAPQPTDRRLARARRGGDPGLAGLLFDYGRYLLVASSRPGSLPAHLQGGWNDSTTPPWSADYHLNINLQMNYWPAEPANLPECAEPLHDYALSLVEPGTRVAQAFYGTRGWVAETCTTPWGWTAPGWDTTWGHFPGGAAWLCRHLWEAYEYSLDRDWLRTRAWPAMRDAALFWLDWFVEGTEGRLVSSPSYSPEHGPFRAGAAMDRQLAADLFSNCLKAASVLGIEDDTVGRIRVALGRIAGPEIGRLGQLKEWLEDLDSPRDHHRHISHAYALHPGEEIDPVLTPSLAAALSRSLDLRGEGGTGWSLAWKMNLRARLGQGDRAERLLRRMTRLVRSGGRAYGEGGGFYMNLFCAHPPFQIDGNFGAAAGILECLVQSQGGLIRVLPALPPAWPEGSLEGARVRGDATVSLAWAGGRLERFRLEARQGGTFRIRHASTELSVSLVAGGSVELDGGLKPWPAPQGFQAP